MTDVADDIDKICAERTRLHRVDPVGIKIARNSNVPIICQKKSPLIRRDHLDHVRRRIGRQWLSNSSSKLDLRAM